MKAKYKYVNGGMDMVNMFLRCRGLDDPFDREIILNKTEQLSPLEDLFDEAALREKIHKAKNVVVFGDYDVDGALSTAIAVKASNHSFGWVVPSRKDGYGLNLDFLKSVNPGDLVITVDCGITAKDVVEEGKKAGIDFVITDHHVPQEEMIPDAMVINPHLSRGKVYEGICGAEVSRRVFSGIFGESDYSLQLSTVATVCDMSPMLSENRALVRNGIESIRNRPVTPLAALLEVLDIPHDTLTERDIGWGIGPVINSAGRMEDASMAVELMLCDDLFEAVDRAKKLVDLNKERKSATVKAVEKAKEVAEEVGECIFAVVEGINPGISGIVAARLVTSTGKPSIVVSVDEEGRCVASSRGTPSFSCVSMVSAIRDKLLSGGGHFGAAGFSFLVDDLDEVKSRIAAYKSDTDRDEEEFYADIEAPLEDAISNIEEIWKLRPFGVGFEPPVFVSEVRVENARTTRGGHLMFRANGINAIAYFRPGLDREIGDRCVMAYTIGVSKFLDGKYILEVVGLEVEAK